MQRRGPSVRTRWLHGNNKGWSEREADARAALRWNTRDISQLGTVALTYPRLHVVRFGGDALTKGVETHRIEGETVRVYSVAVRSILERLRIARRQYQQAIQLIAQCRQSR